MFCKNCGHEVDENADVCLYCGIIIKEEIKNKTKKENSAWAVIGIIFGILGGLVGFIASIIGLCVYPENSQNRKLCWIGLGFSIAWIFIGIIATL